MIDILFEFMKALGINALVFFSFQLGRVPSKHSEWLSTGISLFGLWLLAEVVGRNYNDPALGYFTFFVVGIPYFAGFIYSRY